MMYITKSITQPQTNASTDYTIIIYTSDPECVFVCITWHSSIPWALAAKQVVSEAVGIKVKHEKVMQLLSWEVDVLALFTKIYHGARKSLLTHLSLVNLFLDGTWQRKSSHWKIIRFPPVVTAANLK